MAVEADAPEVLTFLFTDVVGSTELWETEPAAMSSALARHDRLLRSCIESGGGRVFKTVGDAFCAVFASPPAAICAAVDAQRALMVEPWPQGAVLRVRMGLHTGVCEQRDDDYFGPTVNRAARLEAVAHGGQIVLSDTTVEAAGAELPAGVMLRPLGVHRLKDLSVAQQVFQLDIEGLSCQFPPLRSVDNPESGNNLPVQLTRLVGRTRELVEVRGRLGEWRLVTLTGSGGCGKTRLALEAVSDGNGVWFVDLAPLSEPERVPHAVASSLGVLEQPGDTMTATLVDVLRDRSSLIVLDNCEHLIEACAGLVSALLRACSRVRVLATSREPLAVDGEWVYRVPSLSLPADGESVGLDGVRGSEAVELFVERARSHRRSFVLDETNVGSVVAICRQLDGIPLAIELAAARLSSLPLGALEARLDDRFRLLTKGTRSALGRHQTLRAAVEWSYDLLDEPEQAVLRRLAVFAGGFSLEAAEAVCQHTGVARVDVIDVLARLVDKSLIQADEQTDQGRYRLLETIRQFAQEKLAHHDETTAVGAAHAEVFLDLAETAAPRLWKADRARWVAALRVEADNLRLAMATFLADDQSARQAMRLVIALSRYWEMTASTTEAVSFGRAVLDHPGAVERDRLWVETVTALALVWRGENWELAVFKPEVTHAVELARRLQLHQATSVLLWALAAEISVRDLDSATELVEQAVAEAHQSGDHTIIGISLIGSADRHQHDPPEMRARLTEARRHLVAGRDSYWESTILNNLAYAHINEADYESARPLLEQGLDLARPTQDDVLSHLLNNLGYIELFRGHAGAARQAFGEALEYQVRTGSLSVITADLVLGVALCASANTESERALFFHGAVEMMTTSAGDPLGDLSETMATEDRKRLEALLGQEPYEAARGTGMALTPRQAIEQALLYLQQSAPTSTAHRNE